MAGLKLAKKYVVDSQLYVALMGSMLAAFFLLEQNAFRWPKFYLIFLTFFNGYLYTKYQNHHRKFNKILIFNIITGSTCVLLIIKNHNQQVLIRWLLIVILGLLYNSNFLTKTIRNLAFVKIFYVGLIWGLCFGFLGLPEVKWSIVGFSFFYVTALVLAFDIRDLNRDTVMTFPKAIGVVRTQQLAYVFLIIANIIGLIYFTVTTEIILLITSLISALFIRYTSATRSDSYYSFWIESCSGIPLLLWILLESTIKSF